MSFTAKDIQQIEKKGLTVKQVEEQIDLFKSGIPFTNIAEAATVSSGILKLGDNAIAELISYFEKEKNNISLLKFVPASGAASRMFKFLFQFLEDYNPKETSLDVYLSKHNLKDMSVFLDGLEKFPFYNQVLEKLASEGLNYQELSSGEKAWHFVNTMLNKDQLNFGNQPKGLLPFHDYKDSVISTAFEEHLFEAALYASNQSTAKLHFTISEQYANLFAEEFKHVKDRVEEKTGVQFDVSYSYQQSSTDTIAVTPEDEPFRNDDGTVLFRPSGHGALLRNLNALDADIDHNYIVRKTTISGPGILDNSLGVAVLKITGLRTAGWGTSPDRHLRGCILCHNPHQLRSPGPGEPGRWNPAGTGPDSDRSHPHDERVTARPVLTPPLIFSLNLSP